ncbi:MAG: hypothetical protein CMQ45_02405 [Gammaproteobacteria bacterium]|nr:hypothetical protein [Gammaproteobacteria bacterium]
MILKLYPHGTSASEACRNQIAESAPKEEAWVRANYQLFIDKHISRRAEEDPFLTLLIRRL